jgi:hypothetical protein
MGRGGEGKNHLIKDHVLGDHEAISVEIKTAIAFMVVGIAEEDSVERGASLWGAVADMLG